MGFVLTPEEAQALVERDPRNREVLFPYLNGEDLNSRPDQSPSRWVINFHDWPLERAQAYSEPFRIVQEKVKPERELNNRKVYRDYWWHYAEKRPALYDRIVHLQRYLLIPRVSKYLVCVWCGEKVILSEQVVVFAIPDNSIIVLQSAIHDEWARAQGSTLETRMRYTPSDCFETFPFPASLAGLDAIGEPYHEHRRQVMLTRQEGLTKTYNRFHSPDEAGNDIAELRRLHVAMDQAVAVAYGWSDLDLGHSFHETKQGLRYTISEPARRTVFDRLLALNHQRYTDEVALGLHDRGAKKSVLKSGKGQPRKVAEGQGELF